MTSSLSPSRSRREGTLLAFVSAAVLTAANTPTQALAQGCVAARGAGAQHGMTLGEQLPPDSGFQASVGYRWFRSDRHFVGSDEQEERKAEGSEVINNSNFIDLGVTYAFNPRFSAALTVPFVVHDRSQTVRSNDVQRTILHRFSTQSAGLSDVRLSGNMWVLDPLKHPKHNVLLGVGVSAPTGEEDSTDTFQVFDPATKQIVARERTVDQSIQPGTGGWGITLEMYAYRQIVERLNAYVNGAYTFTPEEKNGVPTFRTNPFEAEMSISDTYMGRAGLEYLVLPKQGVTLSLGGRIEGVPVYDAIGGSEGFRRPGFSIAIEPGVGVSYKSWMFNLYTPVALYRNRERSVPDKQQTDATGTFRHGDAAFADFAVMFAMSKRF